MRPFRLELEGFGPYREKQVVDFSDVELFAITGPTGSGKSTLLEAMAFALFKRTPRGQSLEELRHPNAPKVRVVLDFQVGEGVYRVVRHLEAQGGRLLSQDQLFRQEATRWEKVETAGVRGLNQTLEALLGLTYEAFTKALLLPQGEFDRLLKGEARERRALFQSLFGLEHLERAREQARLHLEGVRSHLSALEGELKALEGATFERREALRDELEGLRRELKRLEAELERKQKALLEGQKREEYWHRRSVLEASWSRLEKEAEGLKATREHLEKAQEARRLLPLYQELRAKEEALAEAVRKQGALEAELKRLAEEGARLAPKAERLKAVEEELSRLQGLREREALLRRWGVGLDFAHPDPLPASEGELFALWEERAQAEAYRKAKEVWEEKKRALETAEQGLRALANELSRLEAEGVGAKNRLEALRAEERRRRKGALLLEKARVEEELTSLKGRLIALRQEKERWEQERERMGLARYHARLALGEPCPLCGQTVREIPPLPSLQDPTPRIRALDEEERQLLRRSARLEEELRRLGEALEGLKEVEPEGGDPEEIAEEIARLERVIPELRERYRELSGAYRSRLEEVDRLREEVKRLSPKEPAGRALEAIEKEWARRLAGFVRALREASSGEWPSEREARLLREKEALSSSQRRLEEVTEEGGRLKQTLIAWEARRQELEKQVREAREKVKGLVAEEVLRSAFLTEEEERVLRERLERHERERKEVEAALRALGDPPGPPLAPGEQLRLQEEARALQEALARAQRAMGSLEGELDRLEEALRRRGELEKERGRLTGDLALWQELLKDLEGRNFPAYLLAYYQRGLLARASELLHLLSKGRYRFGAEGERFLVLDAWTDVERPVHTLSGGETFQASLALALALSEQVSRGRLMALFLDEGFGALDLESLEEAAAVLEALPTKGRLVGVVTHVEALAERLPARLKVTKHPSGSRVTWVGG